MSETQDSLQIGEGRPRPAFEPKSLQCPNCASPLTVQSERTRLVICAACNSEVEVTAGEAAVLGERNGLEPAFKLSIGQELKIDGHKYEVTARISYAADDDDYNDPRTHMYLLYSPRRRSLWLSDFNGNWDLSWDSHVAPKQLPFNERRIETFDERSWRVDEAGLAQVEWVDGALPYIARNGDQWIYAECSNSDHQTYEVIRSANELEFSEGRKLEPWEIYEFLGDEAGAARQRKRAHRRRPVGCLPRAVVGGAALFAILVNFFVCFGTIGSGHEVMQQTLRPSDFVDGEGEVMSQPFDLQGGLVTVELEAPGLHNSWVAVDLALVKADGDTIIHVDDMDAEYYEGYEEGEHWTEGDHSSSATWAVPEPGTYQLLVRGRGNRGMSELPDVPPTSFSLTVIDGVMAWWWALFGMLCSGLTGGVVLVIALIAPWKK